MAQQPTRELGVEKLARAQPDFGQARQILACRVEHPLGVIDGVKTKGLETEADIKWRKDFLRKIGYKL